jgi:hypothetical protein
MAYEKAAVRQARVAREGCERREQDRQAEIDAVITEFGGDTDAPAALTRMAEAMLSYRHWLRQFVDAGKMIRQGKPFIVMGPGPHWEPDPWRQFPWRWFRDTLLQTEAHMYADHQEFAAAFARQCRERRNAEAEAQREADELTKPATVPSAADVRKTGAGAGLVFKTRNDARVADDDDGTSVERALPARRASATSGSEMAWWQWVDKRIDYRLEAFARTTETAVGQVVGEIRAQAREHCEREVGIVKRELELTRRELTVLRHEVGVERGLRELRRQVVAAQKAVPKLPEIEARLEAKQACLEHELAMTKDKLGKLRVNQSVADYELREMRKQMNASAGASVELEFESRSAHFQMKATHPDAARALKDFATGIINGQKDGTLWLPGPAGNA